MTIGKAFARLVDQQRWIDEHGGSIDGYVQRYGSKNDPEHYGAGGEAIYAADTAELRICYLIWRDKVTDMHVLTKLKQGE